MSNSSRHSSKKKTFPFLTWVCSQIISKDSDWWHVELSLFMKNSFLVSKNSVLVTSKNESNNLPSFQLLKLTFLLSIFEWLSQMYVIIMFFVFLCIFHLAFLWKSLFTNSFYSLFLKTNEIERIILSNST